MSQDLHVYDGSAVPPPNTDAVHVGAVAQPQMPAGSQPTAPNRNRRFRDASHTLTARLVTGVVVLVLLVVAATGTATYLSLRSYLSGRLDVQLNQAVTAPFSSEGPRPGERPGESPDSAGGPSPQKVWQLILEGNGSTYVTQATNQSTKLMNLTEAQRQRLVSSVGSHTTITTTDGNTLRVVAQTGTLLLRTYNADGSYNSVRVTGLTRVIGLSTGEIDRTLHRLVILEYIIGAGAVLLALGASAWGVRTSLGPLKRVTRTAQEVTAELSPEGAGLDRRVPAGASTTEVGQLAASFNTMLDTVEQEFTARRESEERMRQFLANASHELRTPLTSIRGYAELARMQKSRSRAMGGTESADDDEDSIRRIETEGTRMTRLVEDLLTLARGDDAAGDATIERARIDVSDVIHDAVAGVRAAHPERAIVTQVDPGLTVCGDRDQILRVLRNLATNAAVHTDPSGTIRIEGHREGAGVVLQVADQGPGLAPDDAQHVFERFWRADKARTRVRGGSGLGMAIVAQIVEAHGGQVYFDSSVSHGSTVTVVLPGGGVA